VFRTVRNHSHFQNLATGTKFLKLQRCFTIGATASVDRIQCVAKGVKRGRECFTVVECRRGKEFGRSSGEKRSPNLLVGSG
jgi:hypothetical protein